MMLHADPLCVACVHLRKKRMRAAGTVIDRVTCDAFPEGIPTEIFLRCADHRESWPGDNGIQFELEQGKELPVMFR